MKRKFLGTIFALTLVCAGIFGFARISRATQGQDICDNLTMPAPKDEIFYVLGSSSSATSSGAASSRAIEAGIDQLKYLDVCVVDGYLTQVEHVGIVHKFEVGPNFFAGGQMNLGEILFKALLEVKKNMTWMDEGPSSLSDQSLKDFLLELTQQAVMEATKEGELDKLPWLEGWTEIDKESLKDFLIDALQESLMEVTRTYQGASPTGIDKYTLEKNLSKASLKDFLLYYKDAHEQFLFDMMAQLLEKGRLDWDAVEALKGFELAKIEKAREDVNKLMYETLKELKEEPLLIKKIKPNDPRNQQLGEYLRTIGLKLESIQDCPWGIKVDIGGTDQCVVIKKQGRIVRNVDDYIYEQALKKARDFIMCYFAPWRHFPFGKGGKARKMDWNIGKSKNWCPPDPSDPSKYVQPDNYSNDCNPKNDSCLPKCSTKYICDRMMKQAGAPVNGARRDAFSNSFKSYKNQLCPSDQQKEELKKELLFTFTRKHEFLDRMPPEEWYYGKPDYSGDDPREWWKQGRARCNFIMENITGGISGEQLTGLSGSLKKQRAKTFGKFEKGDYMPNLLIQKGQGAGFLDSSYLHQLRQDKNTKDGQRRIVTNIANNIVAETEKKQSLYFQAGEGITPKQYLVGWRADYGTGADKMDDLYTINTGEIISPAKILTSKIEAAQQAQFDLAMKAWKNEPQGMVEAELECPTTSDGPPVGPISKADYDALDCGPPPPNLQHRWYKVKIPVGATTKTVCKFPVFNELTCRRFGDITMPTRLPTLPQELPAPWEDVSEYADLTQSTNYFKEANQKGSREPPPDLRRKQGQSLWNKYPKIYPEMYADKSNAPSILTDKWGKNKVSEGYYLNKWYKDVTQLYEKPMSQVLCDWFIGEEVASEGHSTIFNDPKLRNIIYEHCLPENMNEYNALPP